MLRILLAFLIPVTVLVGYGCGPGSNGSSSNVQLQAANSKQIFSNAIAEFKVSVYYELGADPYVGPIGLTTNQTWDITKNSYQSLFQNHTGRVVTVPMTLAQMTQFPSQNRSTWNNDDLLKLARQYAPALISGQTANVSVFMLKGTYEGNTNILGIQITGSPYAFVFKDMVTSAGGDSVSQRYVEQASIVHEIGHAVGLVNNGVPMVTPHEDSVHVHHTTNSNCVMYWAVESKSNILSSVGNMILGNQLNLFGPESLQDGRSFHP